MYPPSPPCGVCCLSAFVTIRVSSPKPKTSLVVSSLVSFPFESDCIGWIGSVVESLAKRDLIRGTQRTL